MAAKVTRTQETKIAKAVVGASGVLSPEAAAIVAERMGIAAAIAKSPTDEPVKTGLTFTFQNENGETEVGEISQQEIDGLNRLWDQAQTEGQSFGQFTSGLNAREKAVMDIQIHEASQGESVEDIAALTEADMDADELAYMRSQWATAKSVGVAKEQFLALISASGGDRTRQIVLKFVDFGDAAVPVAATVAAIPTVVTAAPTGVQLPNGVTAEHAAEIEAAWKKAKAAGMDKKSFIAAMKLDAVGQVLVREVLAYLKAVKASQVNVVKPTLPDGVTQAMADELKVMWADAKEEGITEKQFIAMVGKRKHSPDVVKATLDYLDSTAQVAAPVAVTPAPFLTPLDSAAKGKKGGKRIERLNEFERLLIKSRNDKIPSRY